MTRTTTPVFLAIAAALCAVGLGFVLRDAAILRERDAPEDLAGLGRWMTEHPADWRAAASMAEASLDSNDPDRAVLWRTAHAQARGLAPGRSTASVSFVRGGLFHWQELSPADRQDVLRAAAPLLREQRTFMAMHRPLWELTHDLRYLRRNAPPTETALASLREIAVTNGLFADYRELRSALAAQRLRRFREKRASLPPAEMVMLLPTRITANDTQLVGEVLEELKRRPLDAGTAPAARARAAELVRFAVMHDLKPLEGIDALVAAPEVDAATRALLATALGRTTEASNIELAAALNRRESWIPYYVQRSEVEAARGNHAVAAMYRQRAHVFSSGDGWSGLCGTREVCNQVSRTVQAARAGQILEIGLQASQSDEVAPYVEIYLDDALVAEGPVGSDPQQFRVPLPGAGTNRVEVRLANPLTRNRVQRRVRLS